MTLEEEYILDDYKEVRPLNKKETVILVCSEATGQIAVKRYASEVTADIYRQISTSGINGIPEVYRVIEPKNKSDKQTEAEEYIVFEEYICGENVESRLKRGELFSDREIDEFLSYFIPTAGALHEIGIVHRDIKPSNVVCDKEGRYFLVDFGIAVDLKKNIGVSEKGTFGYASPEQYGYMKTTVANDIYSLGVTINVMFTGKLPKEEMACGRYSKVVEKCTRMNPEKRYTNIRDIPYRRTYKPYPRYMARRLKYLNAVFGTVILILICTVVAVSVKATGNIGDDKMTGNTKEETETDAEGESGISGYLVGDIARYGLAFNYPQEMTIDGNSLILPNGERVSLLVSYLDKPYTGDGYAKACSSEFPGKFSYYETDTQHLFFLKGSDGNYTHVYIRLFNDMAVRLEHSSDKNYDEYGEELKRILDSVRAVSGSVSDYSGYVGTYYENGDKNIRYSGGLLVDIVSIEGNRIEFCIVESYVNTYRNLRSTQLISAYIFDGVVEFTGKYDDGSKKEGVLRLYSDGVELEWEGKTYYVWN